MEEGLTADDDNPPRLNITIVIKKINEKPGCH